MYANHRHYILLVFAVAAFAVAVLGYSFLRSKVFAQVEQTAKVTKNIAVIEEKKRREQDVASAYAKLEEERRLLTSYVVSKDGIVNFIEMIEKIGADTSTGLEISGITDEVELELAGETVVGHFKARLEGSGKWANVMRALVLVEHMPYNISLNNIRLSASTAAGTTTSKVWDLSLDIRVLTVK